MTTGFPVSPLTPATFLVVGLTGIELGEHQRFTGPWLFAASLVMTVAAVLFGVFSAVSARPLRIGCGAGYSGDRIEPAVELAERGELDYLVFECLAERTIALAQQAKARDPDARLRSAARRADAKPCCRACRERGVTIITNMGAANPLAAAAAVARSRASSASRR